MHNISSFISLHFEKAIIRLNIIKGQIKECATFCVFAVVCFCHVLLCLERDQRYILGSFLAK